MVRRNYSVDKERRGRGGGLIKSVLPAVWL